MANNNPSPRTRFQPGNNANPRGAGAHDATLRKVRALTDQQFSEVANALVQGSVKDLRKLAKSADTPAVQAMVAAVALRAIDKGDVGAMETLLNRLIGKVKESSKADVPRPEPVLVILPSNGREALLPEVDLQTEDSSEF